MIFMRDRITFISENIIGKLADVLIHLGVQEALKKLIGHSPP